MSAEEVVAVVMLVGYATAHGSTSGVARRIADRLRHGGISVELKPMVEVADVDRYDAFVLGSAVHGGRWLPDAGRFVRHNRDAFGPRPLWVFSVSTIGDAESMFGRWVSDRLRALRKAPPEIAELRAVVVPREHRNFAGAIDRSHWSPTGRVIFWIMGGHYGDRRNWAAIDAWADGIAAQVRQATTRRTDPAPGG